MHSVIESLIYHFIILQRGHNVQYINLFEIHTSISIKLITLKRDTHIN